MIREIIEDFIICIFLLSDLIAGRFSQLFQMMIARNYFDDNAILFEDSAKLSIICRGKDI